jgi:hypothetical protein
MDLINYLRFILSRPPRWRVHTDKRRTINDEIESQLKRRDFAKQTCIALISAPQVDQTK